MTVKRAMSDHAFQMFAEMARVTTSREYDCSIDQYIQVIQNTYRKPWSRLWIALDGDQAVGYLWATADMTMLRDQVGVGDLYVKVRHKGVMEALLNALGEWAFGQLKAKRIKFHSPHSLRAWQRIMGRLKHEVRVTSVNCYLAEGGKEWGERETL